MKKTIILLILALALSSCAKESVEYAAPGNILISGGFASATKTTVDNLSSAKANVLWSEGDCIGIFSAENGNAMARLSDACVGRDNGVFIPKDATPAGSDLPVVFQYPESGKSEFLVYYPYSKYATMDMTSSTITSTVEPSQTQNTLSDLSIGKYGFSYGKTTVDASDPKVNFTLQHAMAYVCLRATYADAEGYQLHSVELYDPSSNMPVAGKFTFDVNTGKIASVADGAEYAAQVVASNHDFSKTPETEDLYLTILPGDYTKVSFIVVISFINAAGNCVTIPVQKTGGWNFRAGTVSVLDLGQIHKSDCNLSWYETEETRDLLGGYAYGPQNTYFVCTDDNEITYTFDVKARGDFAKVRKPAYYGFILFKDRAYNSFLKFTDGAQGQDSFSTSKDNFVPSETHRIGDDCTFSVISLTNTPYKVGTTFSVIGIYDENKDLIWSYMIQRYNKSDPPVAIEYKDLGISLLDRSLGQATGSGKLSDSSTESGDLFSYGALFQWGRKDPFPYVWEKFSQYKKASAPDGDDSKSTIENAIRHPYRIYLLNDTQNWMPDMPENLWGGTNNTSDWCDPADKGHKTIYDPCPEGYRVCDGNVLKSIAEKGERWERYSIVKKYHSGADASKDHPTYFGGSCIAYPLGDGKYDYWLYSGYSSGSTFNTGRSSTASDSGGLYWANNFYHAEGKPAMYQWLYTSSFNQGAYATGASYMLTVRCQKED